MLHKNLNLFNKQKLSMLRKLILLLPLLFFIAATVLSAQQSSKSKSKDRFREKNDRQYPVRVTNSNEINQEGVDIAPAYFKQGIVFVSSRAKSGPRDSKTNETYAELYYAFFNYNGEPSFPQKVQFTTEKRSNFHDGPVCFTRDSRTAYLTLNNNKDGVLKVGKNGKSNLKIYEARYARPDWTKAKELPFNGDDYNCMHPSLSPDGTKMFFASDMPGGQGGYDIYVVERTASGWGLPVNLGPVINTAGQEIFPFISQSGSLFFSSNGRSNTLGGLDNYYVNNPLENPEEVVNLGEDFNTNADDMSFIIDDEGKTGFFSSNRVKGQNNKDDIYRFEAPRGLEGVGKPEVSPTQITVTDAKTGKPLQKAAIRILQPSDDGFVSGNKDFYSIDLTPVQDRPNALSLQLVRKGADDLGAADLYSNVDGKAQHDFTRYHNYLVVVSLDGYAPKEKFISIDDRDQSLNFALSEAPACLRAGGIVLTTGFGTRIANASIKFVHRESSNTFTARTNWYGEYDICLPLEGDYIAYVERPGFKPENYRLKTTRGDRHHQETRLESLTPDATIETTMPLANGLQDGSTIILDKIFYEYNKATLNQSAVRYLDALLEMLKKYPEMEIDLIAHTETRGDARLNQELTDARAENAKTYLVYKDKSTKNRINAYGKGESEPRNRCTDGVECSDDEHQQNNRLEVRIRKVGRIPRP